jgi:5,10-methylenetetrahydromethanopterin reductase
VDYGIALAPGPNSWQVVKRAEELGFHFAWFYDTQLLAADVFVAMGAAAVKTDRIKLATGVLIPSNRIAPVAANAMASLNAIAPGRIVLGVGTGFTGRNTMGMKAMRLRDFKEYMRIVRALWAGETTDWEFEGERRKIRFLNPELGLINIDTPIPVHVSGFGPKSRQYAAELAEGWINFVGPVANALRQADQMAEACAAAGRQVSTCYRTAFTLGAVLREGEGMASERAFAQAGPLAAVALHSIVESGASLDQLPQPLRALAEEYQRLHESYEPADARYLSLHRGHLLFVRPDEAKFVTPELIQARTFTGTRAELRDRVRALAEGYDQFTVQLVPGHEDAIDDWADVLAEV